jgi:hypothetical protein
MLGKNLTKDVFYAGKKPTYFFAKKEKNGSIKLKKFPLLPRSNTN